MTSTTSLLRLEGVSKSFPGVKALQDMHLDLRHGEVLALVGENGAGKSTLMKLLSGSYLPDSGEFWLDGEPYRVSGPQHAMQTGISIIHQEFNLMDELTIAQNIYIGREPRALGVFNNDRQLNRKAAELLGRLALPLDPHRLVGTLTVAQQQMVEIAKALSYDGRVLIMDEPTAALNDTEVATLHQLIRRYRTPETGVIYISHKMDELKQISDRITVIRDGKYIDTLDTEATSMPEVISLMVGREIAQVSRGAGTPIADEVVLDVEGLSTKELLSDVSFQLHRGEILGFAGLMGAGRTEVARAIVGADRISAGRLTMNGRSIRVGNPAQAAGHGIGYLSEDRKKFGLLLDRSVKDNIGLAALGRKFTSFGFVADKRMRARARGYVESLNIRTPSIDQLTTFLSGGNQQKVVIAKWLLEDCQVLIFDEPTRGIDVGAKEEIYRLLDELSAAGKSIIMISSELPEVLRMSHRIVVMTEGRVTGVLSAAEADSASVMHLATLRPSVVAVRATSPPSDAAHLSSANTPTSQEGPS